MHAHATVYDGCSASGSCITASMIRCILTSFIPHRRIRPHAGTSKAPDHRWWTDIPAVLPCITCVISYAMFFEIPHHAIRCCKSVCRTASQHDRIDRIICCSWICQMRLSGCGPPLTSTPTFAPLSNKKNCHACSPDHPAHYRSAVRQISTDISSNSPVCCIPYFPLMLLPAHVQLLLPTTVHTTASIAPCTPTNATTNAKWISYAKRIYKSLNVVCIIKRITPESSCRKMVFRTGQASPPANTPDSCSCLTALNIRPLSRPSRILGTIHVNTVPNGLIPRSI